MMAYYSFCVRKSGSANTVKGENEFQTVEMYGKTNTIDETAEDDPEAKPK